MTVFKRMYNLTNQSDDEYANTKGWIVSIATAGAVFGCLGCIPLTQKFGCKITMQIGTGAYMAGVFGQTFSRGSLGGLYASRFISGMGIGTTSVLPSVYISEVSRVLHTVQPCPLLTWAHSQISPRSIRGLMTLQYAACQQLGVIFGFFFNYGVTKYHTDVPLQYQLPTALQLVPAAIWGIGTFFTPESPRYLLAKNKKTQALQTLARFRRLPVDHEYVQEEFAGIDGQLNHEIEAVAGSSSWDLLKETFTVTSNRRRFILIFCCHLFSQWSGANAITQYSPTILSYLGIAGEQTRFLTTGIYGIVKFVSTLLCAIFLIDFIGRRRSLMTGITLQLVTLTFIGAYLGVTNGRSAEEIEANPSAKAASTASIVAIFFHAIAWSIGWFAIPYLVSSEVFPIRIRSLNVSILTAFHWAFYFACSRAMPSLLVATDRYGAFAFFGSICLISLIYVYFAMPETSGRSLESMDSLFERPWYTVHKVAYASADDGRPEYWSNDAKLGETESEMDVRVHDDDAKAAA